MEPNKRFKENISAIPDDEDSEDDEIEKVPFSTIEEEYNNSKKPCWACISNFGKPDDGSPEGKNMVKLNQSIIDNMGKMSNRSLATLVRRAWVNLIKTPNQLLQKETMDWPEDMILAHISHHMTSAGSERAGDVHKMKILQKICLDNLMDASGSMDHDCIKRWVELSKHKQTLLQQPLTRESWFM